MTLHDDLQSLCDAHGFELRKGLGQHFLTEERVLGKILAAAQIAPSDHVLEIGPGAGILTRELLKYAGHVTAIELDRRCLPLLEDYTARDGHGEKLTIIQGDALRVDLPTSPYKVVANLPYQITSPILYRLLVEADPRPSSLTLLIQREVAQKICEKEEGNRINILARIFGAPRIVARVSASAFFPPPKVESAVLHLDSSTPIVTDRAVIDRILGLAGKAFQGKRKMLRNTLGDIPGGMEAMQKHGIDPTRRPETLTMQEWTFLGQEERLDPQAQA